MKIVVIGSTGLIGSPLVATLRAAGHEAVAASPEAGVNTVTGEGLADALAGTAVVVDVSDPPCLDDGVVMEFYRSSTRNLLEHGMAAGVTHYVALSPVGTDQMLDSGYFRARCAQEQLIKASRIAYSIVRTTILYESLARIADVKTYGAEVRVPPVLVQPVAAKDVVRLIASIAAAGPLNGTIEVGGPEPFYLDGLVQRVLGAKRDRRDVIGDPHARYFGAQPGERSLVAGDEAELGEIRFDDWLRNGNSGANGVSGMSGVNGANGTTGTNGVNSASLAPAGSAASDGSAALKENEFRISDVPPGSVLLMGHVAVFSAAGGFCATQAMCTHKAGPLSEGTVDDTTVTCPLHGSQFNIWTGAVLRGPATQPLKTYQVVVDGDVGRVVS